MLSAEAQRSAFIPAAPGTWRVILATSIAETSVTLPDVTHVIDSGLCKEIQYDADTDMHSLREGPVCRATADQRAGRAGRVGPGVCWRLYSESFYCMGKKEEIPRVGIQYPRVAEVNSIPVLQRAGEGKGVVGGSSGKGKEGGGGGNHKEDYGDPTVMSQSLSADVPVEDSVRSQVKRMEPFAVPEIRRVALEELILQVNTVRQT